MTTTPKIYAAMQSVMRDVCAIGIGKDSRNKDQGYQFRGIEAAMNALAPLLVKHGIVCVPRHTSTHRFDRLTKSGGTLSFVMTDSEFDLIQVEDGSKVTVQTKGEGMDSSDKATNKAMSTAFKYALFQTFVVPTMAIDIEDDDGGASEAEQEAERQEWITSQLDRLRIASATLHTLKEAWQKIKAECQERNDIKAAEELLIYYKKMASEIADRAAGAE